MSAQPAAVASSLGLCFFVSLLNGGCFCTTCGAGLWELVEQKKSIIFARLYLLKLHFPTSKNDRNILTTT